MEEKSQKPNLLVIMADQLRRQALGCYGDRNAHTPHIDRLADQGVRFANSCSTFPVCVPFRFSFMTGQYPHTRGMPSIGYRMSPTERTIADVWNESGYHTAYFGKWHLYGGGHGTLPDYDHLTTNRIPVPRKHQGRWQKWFGFELCNSHFDTCYFEDDDPRPRKLDSFQTDGMFDLAIDYLGNQKNAKDPFACVLSIEPPHPPYEAPEELAEKWLNTTLEEDPNFLFEDESITRFKGDGNLIDPSQREAAIQAERYYYAMVENFDQNVGRMMQALEDSGQRENTIVVVLADHGHCGFRHCWQQKGMPFEEAIGIPLIISDPRHKEQWGSVPDQVVCTEDLFPTLLGLTEVESGTTPGENFAGLVNDRYPIPERDGILIENTYIVRPDLPRFDKGWRGLRNKRYKYTLEGGIKGGAKPWQFYDLQEDPYEMNNLVNDLDKRELIQEHHRLLLEKLREAEDDYPVAAAFDYSAQNLPIM